MDANDEANDETSRRRLTREDLIWFVMLVQALATPDLHSFIALAVASIMVVVRP